MKGKTLLAFAAGMATAWLAWENTHLQISRYAIADPALPQGLDGVRIAQISDFHNTACKQVREQLLEALVNTKPDLIVVTGDLIDSRHTDPELALSMMECFASVAPTYYVAGNHESRIPHTLSAMETELASFGVMVLHDQAIRLRLRGAELTLCGLYDPAFVLGEKRKTAEASLWVQQTLSRLLPKEGYQVVLCHRPELFETYCKTSANLVFCGHAHGGQGRFPWGGGLIAPQQGFFPKYTEGCHSQNGTTMVVSRGIGNSLIPMRVNNRPELVLVTLKAEKE